MRECDKNGRHIVLEIINKISEFKKLYVFEPKYVYMHSADFQKLCKVQEINHCGNGTDEIFGLIIKHSIYFNTIRIEHL